MYPPSFSCSNITFQREFTEKYTVYQQTLNQTSQKSKQGNCVVKQQTLNTVVYINKSEYFEYFQQPCQRRRRQGWDESIWYLLFERHDLTFHERE